MMSSERMRLEAAFELTVDGERGRRLRLAHHVLRHARVRAHVGRGQTADLQGVVLADLVPGGGAGGLETLARPRVTSQEDAAPGSNIPSFGQVAVVFPPAHRGNWVTAGLTPELDTLVHQHHLADRTVHKAGTLCISKKNKCIVFIIFF